MITEYMAGFADVETATSYDFWCACWLVSNVLGRKITVPRPHAPVHLNMYAIICAEAGITRKSTAVRHATNVLNLYRDNHDGQFDILTGSTTPEKLTSQLQRLTAQADTAHVALSSSELVTLLGRGSATGLPGLLTDLYDCPTTHTRQTMGTGVTTARNVYVTMLAASTPSWLARAVNPDVIEGGFTSRCLFVVEEKPKRLVAWPNERQTETFTRDMAVRLAALSGQVDYVVSHAGGIRPTEAAKRSFTEWYEGRVLSSDPYAATFQAREDHHILRVAAILAASDNTWEIQEQHVRQSIKVINWIRRSGVALFGSGIAASRVYSLVDRVRQALLSSGRSGLSQSAITSLCRKHGSHQEQNQVLAIMHEMQLIQKFMVDTGDKGRPTTLWRATRSLAQAKALEDVVDLIAPQE